MQPSAHVDTFARDRLPAPADQPAFLFELPALQFPPRLNCAAMLLDDAVARGWGGRRCVIGADGTVWTYAELQAQANRIAHVLVQDMGLVPGNRVLLRAPNSPMLAACWCAVMKAGGIAVGTMPMLRAKELGQILAKAQVSHALCDAALADELALAAAAHPVLREVLHFGVAAECGLEARAARQSDAFATVDTAADDVCLLAFTSGTTGLPKATMHVHRDVMAACACFPPHVLRPVADDVFIGSPPLAFTFGLGGLLLFPLSVGAATVLLPKAGPNELLEAVPRHGATVLFTAPTSYRAMAEAAGQRRLAVGQGGTLRKCVSAGEALPAATRALWQQATGITLIDGIGATELLHIFISADETQARPGATGKAIPGYRACVVDANLQPVPPGTVGRLAVQGPTGCRYLDDARQASYVQGGWNLTGDAYVQDADGYFHYQSRTDDMIISAGYNIAGPEVEDCLLRHPAVAECGVAGVPDDERGQIVKAWVVLKPGMAGDAACVQALQDFVKANIAPYKYPRAVDFVDSLPRTETGKLQRFRLRAG
ncbi:AMP-binding protein [Pseudaquabacterium pictum]|uniref:2-aminobenzoate-CoA ligase n=1 Tax=Pseudaquabacterium pictum TaxID=2315236 RepID=A0A480ALN8_9BURK|nr:AMP-binding protein [Rubrivivax pictus]GCL61317.1 2-aminobenzoate-CoA ligase [Rubrivivax pictus]